MGGDWSGAGCGLGLPTQPFTVSTPCTVTKLTNNRWTLGSLLFLSSWAVMLGPLTYLRHLTSGPRLPFTAAYFGSIGLTLYFTLGVRLVSLFPLPCSLPSSSCPSLFFLSFSPPRPIWERLGNEKREMGHIFFNDEG